MFRRRIALIKAALAFTCFVLSMGRAPVSYAQSTSSESGSESGGTDAGTGGECTSNCSGHGESESSGSETTNTSTTSASVSGEGGSQPGDSKFSGYSYSPSYSYSYAGSSYASRNSNSSVSLYSSNSSYGYGGYSTGFSAYSNSYSNTFGGFSSSYSNSYAHSNAGQSDLGNGVRYSYMAGNSGDTFTFIGPTLSSDIFSSDEQMQARKQGDTLRQTLKSDSELSTNDRYAKENILAVLDYVAGITNTPPKSDYPLQAQASGSLGLGRVLSGTFASKIAVELEQNKNEPILGKGIDRYIINPTINRFNLAVNSITAGITALGNAIYSEDNTASTSTTGEADSAGGASPNPDDDSKFTDNDVNHVFGQTKHNLSGLVSEYGSSEKAMNALQQATEQKVAANGISGIFKEVVKVGSETVTVKGNVINGIVRIGTAFIP